MRKWLNQNLPDPIFADKSLILANESKKYTRYSGVGEEEHKKFSGMFAGVMKLILDNL